MILFLKLLLAHLIGDFFLQPNKWVAEKEIKKHKSSKLYWHILLHFVLIMLFVWDLSFLWMAIIISLLHGLTDFLKLNFQNVRNKRYYFFIDQFVHIFILIAAVFYQEKINISAIEIFSERNLLLITAILFLTTPSSLIVKTFISIWTPQVDKNSRQIETISLQKAGRIIGILERLMIFVFILLNRWEAVGFLITAKSVFRFSDLKQAQDRKLTEYILIGTLSSFGIAILCGIIVNKLIQ